MYRLATARLDVSGEGGEEGDVPRRAALFFPTMLNAGEALSYGAFKNTSGKHQIVFENKTKGQKRRTQFLILQNNRKFRFMSFSASLSLK